MLASLPESNQETNEEEVAIAFSGPALLANRFYVTLTQGGLRIAFAERSATGAPVFRTAVGLAFPDAVALYKVLGEGLKQREAALKAVASAPRVAKAN